MFRRFVGIAACIFRATKLSCNGCIHILSHYGGGDSYETSEQHKKLFVTLIMGVAVRTICGNSIKKL